MKSSRSIAILGQHLHWKTLIGTYLQFIAKLLFFQFLQFFLSSFYSFLKDLIGFLHSFWSIGQLPVNCAQLRSKCSNINKNDKIFQKSKIKSKSIKSFNFQWTALNIIERTSLEVNIFYGFGFNFWFLEDFILFVDIWTFFDICTVFPIRLSFSSPTIPKLTDPVGIEKKSVEHEILLKSFFLMASKLLSRILFKRLSVFCLFLLFSVVLRIFRSEKTTGVLHSFWTYLLLSLDIKWLRLLDFTCV